MYCWQEKIDNQQNGQINRVKTTISVIYFKYRIISMHKYVYKCVMVIRYYINQWFS